MIANYRDWVVYVLESWVETYNNQHPDNMETIIEDEERAYYYIKNLISKFSKSTCSIEDYEDILFHIWQSKAE